jgi:hypothetical protein
MTCLVIDTAEHSSKLPMTLLNKAPLTILRVIKTSEHNSALSLTLVNKTPLTICRVI